MVIILMEIDKDAAQYSSREKEELFKWFDIVFALSSPCPWAPITGQ